MSCTCAWSKKLTWNGISDIWGLGDYYENTTTQRRSKGFKPSEGDEGELPYIPESVSIPVARKRSPAGSPCEGGDGSLRDMSTMSPAICLSELIPSKDADIASKKRICLTCE